MSSSENKVQCSSVDRGEVGYTLLQVICVEMLNYFFIKRWSGIAINIEISKKSSKFHQVQPKKVVTTKYLTKFQSPRVITRPKFIGPERNANLICNSSLYTLIPNIKSISQSIAKKSGDNCFISELRIWVTLYVPATQWWGLKNIYLKEYQLIHRTGFYFPFNNII